MNAIGWEQSTKGGTEEPASSGTRGKAQRVQHQALTVEEKTDARAQVLPAYALSIVVRKGERRGRIGSGDDLEWEGNRFA